MIRIIMVIQGYSKAQSFFMHLKACVDRKLTLSKKLSIISYNIYLSTKYL